MKRFTHGVVAGKFAPPHQGHHYLINTAVQECEKVTVFMVDTAVKDCVLNIAQRVEILHRTHPTVEIHVIPDIEVDDFEDSSILWGEYTKAMLGENKIDAVFSSEGYGKNWARELGATNREVDPKRSTIPVSATFIRQNPNRVGPFLSKAGKRLLLPRISIIGAESTGTSTLAEKLGEHYKEPVVPEYGRIRDEKRLTEGLEPNKWTEREFVVTARSQQMLERRMAEEANELLICDTDPFVTGFWQERYLGYYNPDIELIGLEQKYMLRIVTNWEEVDPEEDGLRFEMHKRKEMQDKIETRLKELNLPWIRVTGSVEERVKQSTAQIDFLMS